MVITISWNVKVYFLSLNFVYVRWKLEYKNVVMSEFCSTDIYDETELLQSLHTSKKS